MTQGEGVVQTKCHMDFFDIKNQITAQKSLKAVFLTKKNEKWHVTPEGGRGSSNVTKGREGVKNQP